MKRFAITLLAACALAAPALATDEKRPVVVRDHYVITTPITGCARDMNRWCRHVTPGANRPLLCLLAHEDKLTERCELGILEAALANEVASGTLGNAYGACETERATLCGNVEVGEGRLARCVRENEAKISAACTAELKRTGLWDLLHANMAH
ncbi:MAG TPA: hypothetical protein DDX54_03715 [Rhodospirillaceae bacterium]|jgi:hypothetical protein|nr:hypothetical protein [Alphaproteobacteria bacterium]HBH26490.1 hypothetical protein [Rhodospirillaceae bacterium]